VSGRTSQEEWDARAGEDEYGLAAEDLARQGYRYDDREKRWVSPEVWALRCLLLEAVEWARRPSPIPVVPFQEFIDLAKAATGDRSVPRGALERWSNMLIPEPVPASPSREETGG